jgi:two-component system, chemotaxis family, chemotaxis protein CheY
MTGQELAMVTRKDHGRNDSPADRLQVHLPKRHGVEGFLAVILPSPLLSKEPQRRPFPRISSFERELEGQVATILPQGKTHESISSRRFGSDSENSGQSTFTNGPSYQEVREAADGVEALTVMQEFTPTLILSDINMPNLDGLQFLTKVRTAEAWKSTPVIMVSTEGNQAKVLEAVQLGANGYARKPFTPEQIKEKVLYCLAYA